MYHAWKARNKKRTAVMEENQRVPQAVSLSISVWIYFIFYCCCLFIFISSCCCQFQIFFFLRAPVYHEPFLLFALFFYLWMKQNIDFFFMTSSSSFPQAFFLYFSLYCATPFLTHHFSPYFLYFFYESILCFKRVWISRKRCWKMLFCMIAKYFTKH